MIEGVVYLNDGKVLINNSIKFWFDATDNYHPKAEYDKSIISEQEATEIIDEFVKIMEKSLS